MRIMVLGFLTCALVGAQEVPVPAVQPTAVQPPAVPVVELDIAPLSPPDLDTPYASPRDAARHRFQSTLAQLQSDRNTKAALRGLAEALALDRTYAAAAFNLGVIAAIAEKWDDAVAALEEAARLDPGLATAAAPQIERLRLISSLEKTAEGKRKRQYDEALYPVIANLQNLPPAAAMASLAEVGRIDPQRWEAPALLGGLNGNGQGYDVAARFLEIAVTNAKDPAIKASLQKALDAAQRELRYSAARSAAEAAADRGEYQKAGELFENAWAAMPARVSNGMEAASAWLLNDDTARAAALLVRLQAHGDSQFAAPAAAMLKELEPIEPGAKAAADAGEFFRDAGSPDPLFVSDLVPRIDTTAMEILARPLPRLVPDREPVVLLAALSANPEEAAQGGALPPLRAPRVAGESPWRDLTQLRNTSPPPVQEAPAPLLPRALAIVDLTGGAPGYKSIKVTTQPAGAHVFVGDAAQPVCQTPCDVQAVPGNYSVRVSLPGYQEETRQVRIADSGEDLELPLKRARGNIIVEAPPAAILKVNGTAIANRPPVELSLLPGLYRIGADSRERAITIKPGARLRLLLEP